LCERQNLFAGYCHAVMLLGMLLELRDELVFVVRPYRETAIAPHHFANHERLLCVGFMMAAAYWHDLG